MVRTVILLILLCSPQPTQGTLAEAEGPCGSSSGCAADLVCGYNNCPREDNMHQPGDDCCTRNRTAMCFGGVFLTDNCCGETGECRENEGDCDEGGCAPGFKCGSSNCDDSGPGDKFYPNDDCCTRVSCWGTETGCCKGQCLEGQGPCLYNTECEDGFDCQDACEYGMCCTRQKFTFQATMRPLKEKTEEEATAESDCQKQATKGADYTGPANTTNSSQDCQNWSLQSPHKHGFLHEDHNLCRNPSSETAGEAVWCFTTDPGTRWEYCPVPYCSELTRGDAGNTTVLIVPEQILQVEAGAHIVLDCRVENGSSASPLTWRKKGKEEELESRDGLLYIPTLSMDQAGTYVCTDGNQRTIKFVRLEVSTTDQTVVIVCISAGVMALLLGGLVVGYFCRKKKTTAPVPERGTIERNSIYGLYHRGFDGEGEYGDGDVVEFVDTNPTYEH